MQPKTELMRYVAFLLFQPNHVFLNWTCHSQRSLTVTSYFSYVQASASDSEDRR